MDTIKAGEPLVEVINLLYEADQSGLLLGPPGVGKSEILATAARKRGIEFIVRDLSLMEPTDLIGLPYRAGKVTRYAPPEFLPRKGKGLLVFEELNRCERYMRAPCLQLLTARRLNDYILPPGWVLMAAINPSGGEYETADLDPALRSRFVEIEVVADREQWLEWARDQRIHPAVVHHVEGDTTVFDGAKSNPRSWQNVSKLLNAARKVNASNMALRSVVIGMVGDTQGSAFMATLGSRNALIPGDALLKRYPGHRDQVLGWKKDGQLDLVEDTLRDVLLHLQVRRNFNKVHSNASQKRNLALFLHDLPAEQRDVAKAYFAERNYTFPPAPKVKEDAD